MEEEEEKEEEEEEEKEKKQEEDKDEFKSESLIYYVNKDVRKFEENGS